MMERVQIQGGSNGVYIDAKGRHLRTMGDFAPSPGQWVYTNGVTIYGHQTATQQPFVFTCTDDPILPLCCYAPPSDGCTAQQLAGVLNDGSWEHFVDFKYGDTPLYGYVGDGRHAYGCTYYYNGEKSTYKWYNLLTGKSLGVFDADDACIGEHGELLTIEHQDGLKYLNDDNRKYKHLVINEERKKQIVSINKESYDNVFPCLDQWEGWYDEFSEDYVDMEQTEKRKEKDFYIRVRKNGQIIKEFTAQSFDSEITGAISDIEAEAHKLHNAGTGGMDRPWAQAPRPTAGAENVSISVSHLKIYSNMKYLIFVTLSVEGAGYPMVGVPSIDWKVTSVNPINNYKDISGSQIVGHPYEMLPGFQPVPGYDSWDEVPAYQHETGYETVMNDQRGAYKDWIRAGVTRVMHISIGEKKVISLDTKTASVGSNGALLGDYAIQKYDERKYSGHVQEGTEPKIIKLLTGYNFTSVICPMLRNNDMIGDYISTGTIRKAFHWHRSYKGHAPGALSSFGWAWSSKDYGAVQKMYVPCLVVIGSGAIDKDRNTIDFMGKYRKMWDICTNQQWITSQTLKEEKGECPTTYDIGRGFSIKLYLAKPYIIDSVQGFKIVKDNKIIVDTENCKQLASMAYFFEKIRITVLAETNKKTRYLLTNTTGYFPAYLIENGNCTPIQNISQALANYTLVPFKQKKKLKRGITKLLKKEANK